MARSRSPNGHRHVERGAVAAAEKVREVGRGENEVGAKQMHRLFSPRARDPDRIRRPDVIPLSS